MLYHITILCAIPVLQQLVTVQIQPLKDHTQRTSGHFTLHHTIFDADHNLVITISRMEMGRSMILKIHKNGDSVKRTNLRHN